MIRFMFAIGVVATGLAQAAPSGPPAGTYTGTATWRGQGGSTGIYKVERTFNGGTMTAHYEWTEPKPREETHAMTLAMKESEPFFDVLDEKQQVVGKGYCYDDVCGYHLTVGPVMVDETFRWSEGSMHVFGAKSGPGFSVVWKETLKSR